MYVCEHISVCLFFFECYTFFAEIRGSETAAWIFISRRE